MEAKGIKSLENLFLYDESELVDLNTVMLTVNTDELLVGGKCSVGL